MQRFVGAKEYDGELGRKIIKMIDAMPVEEKEFMLQQFGTTLEEFDSDEDMKMDVVEESLGYIFGGDYPAHTIESISVYKNLL